MTHTLSVTRAYRIKEDLAILSGFDDVSGIVLGVFCPYSLFKKIGLESLEIGKGETYVYEGIEVKFKYHKSKTDENKYFAWVVD